MSRIIEIGIFVLVVSGVLMAPLMAVEAKKSGERTLRVDGKLDDRVWKEITSPLSVFHLFGEDEGISEDTRAKIAYDDKYLYFSLECANADPGYDLNAEKTRDAGVSNDDSIEIFIASDADRKSYAHFMLNCANVKTEQRVFGGGATRRSERNWDPTWLSSVTKSDRGWTAEIAIPLALFAENGKVGPLSFNIFRTKVVPEFDAQGVRLGAKKQYSSLFPVKTSPHEPDAFGELKGPETARLPDARQTNWQTGPCRLRLEDAAVGSYYFKDGKPFYDVIAKIAYGGDTYNWAYVVAIDKTASGKRTETTEKTCVAANRRTEARLPVPVGDIEKRTVTVTLKDYVTEGVADQLELLNLDKLTPLDAFFDRNYYTSEKRAELLCAVSLPSGALKNLSVTVTNDKGDLLFRSDKISADNVFPIDLEKVPVGANAISLAMSDKDGTALFKKALILIKRTPNPGREWKIDQRGLFLLNNGTPFFPFGVTCGSYLDVAEEGLREMKSLGCNMFLKWVMLTEPGLSDAIFEAAEKHGFYVMDNIETYHYAPYGKRSKIPNLSNYLSGEELKKTDSLYSIGSLQSTLNSGHPAFKKLTRAQRNAIFDDFYRLGLSRMTDGIKAAAKHKCLMGYHTFDEPRFTGFDMFVQGRDLYRLTNEIDGYHPTLVLYYPPLPLGAETTDWCDILCTDPYWVPEGTISGRSSINYLSKVVWMTKQRADAERKMTWIVPMSGSWCATHKRPISPAEQICQSYLTIIHGAKGLLYFTLPPYKPSRDAIKTVGEHIKALSPAILAPPVKQEIVYSPVAFKPEKDRFPDVQVALFQYPEGDAVLLAANTADRPVNVSYALSCLPKNAEISRWFAPDTYPVRDGAFADNVEPFGVRAYRVKTDGKLVGPVRIFVKSTTDDRVPSSARSETIDYFGRPGKKNIFPNPSFEDFTLPDWPDYVRLFYKTVVGDHLKLVETDPYDGKRCIELTNRQDDPSGRLVERVGFHTYCAPQNPKAENYTLSVYMKGSRDGMEVYFGSYDWKTWDGDKWLQAWKPVKITKEWKRYAITGPVPANADRYIWVGVQLYEYGTVWIDAAQVEKGDKATEFER